MKSLLAGTARIDITCPDVGAPAYVVSEKTLEHIPKELWDKKITVDDPLYLRVLVLDDGSRKYAFITMDTTAIGCRTITQDILGDSADDFMPRLRERLLADGGVEAECVTVCASHTHPPGRLLCDDDAQINKAAEAVRTALQNMVPVRIGSASSEQRQLTINRTLMMKDGTDYTLRICNPYPPDDEVEALRPVDPEVCVLRVDRLDGTPLAVLYNFACHLLIGTVGWNITADFPGVTSEYVERTLGHDVMAFFTQGAGGDVHEISQMDVHHPVWGRDFGVTLGESVLEAYRKAKPTEVSIRLVSEVVSFPLRKDISEVVSALREEQAALLASTRYTNLHFKSFLPLYLKYTMGSAYPLNHAYRYMQAEEVGNPGYTTMDTRNTLSVEKYLSSMRAMERMARNEEKIATLLRHQEVIDTLGTTEVNAEIQGILMGDCVCITAPMEVLTETGLKVKKSSPFPHTFVASDANGYLHYAPPASYYARGGYESTECLLDPAWEAVFFDAVERIFRRLQEPLKSR